MVSRCISLARLSAASNVSPARLSKIGALSLNPLVSIKFSSRKVAIFDGADKFDEVDTRIIETF